MAQSSSDRLLTLLSPWLQVGGAYVLAEGASVRLRVMALDDAPIMIQALHSLAPGYGYVSTLMQTITELADLLGVPLVLKAEPYSTKQVPEPWDRADLVAFYQRHGFSEQRYGGMRRQPQRSKPDPEGWVMAPRPGNL